MFLMKTQVARESGVTQNDDNNTFAAALLSCPISHMCLFTTINFRNQCKFNKHSSLRFHCFNTFDVAPSPGIALVSVCELSGRAVQPTDGGLLPLDVGGARGGGERSDPSGHSSAEQQTNAAPPTDDLSGSLPKQYCGRCTLIRIAIPDPIFPRP